MSLKGTRTEQNLLAAFSGESMARNKYLFFAEKARTEGNLDVANLFTDLAQNEGAHGRLLYEKVVGIGSSAENLQTAIKGEYGEWSSMYPDFAKIAREEGFEDVATLFENIAKIEKDHEMRFFAALAALTNKGTSTPVEQPEQKRMVKAQGYRCTFCGAIYDKRPDVCDVCGAIGSFEETIYQKEV